MILRSLDEVAGAVTDAAAGRTRTIVGIAGSPGAGKSTLAAALVARLDSAILLPMDGYHLPQATLLELGRRDRMGAPDTFDVSGLVASLAAVRNSGRTVFVPGFDRGIEEPVSGAIAILPELRTVVVEGNYLMLDSGGWEEVAPLLDLTLFLRVDPEIRRSRLIARHERYGKSPDAARAWALGPDEDNARVVENTAVRADHIVQLGDEG